MTTERPPPSKGAAGSLEVTVLEIRGLQVSDVHVIVELGAHRFETAPKPENDLVFGETFTLPVHTPAGYLYMKVVSGGYVSNEVMGRACITLSQLYKEKRADCWLELLPPAIGEDATTKGTRFRALSPAVYRGGLPNTMNRYTTPQAIFLNVSVKWVDPPSGLDCMLAKWDWEEPVYPVDRLDWFGNLFISAVDRITTAVQLPCTLAAVRRSSLSNRLMVVSLYVMFVLYVKVWMLPMTLFVFVAFNGLYHAKYIEGAASAILLYEDDNPIDPPTILSSLVECCSAPTAILNAQGWIANLASTLERLAFLFIISEAHTAVPLAGLFVVCASASLILYSVPLRIFFLAPGIIFLLTGGEEEVKENADKTDIDTEEAVPEEVGDKEKEEEGKEEGKEEEEKEKDPAAPAPLLKPRKGPLGTVCDNLWMMTPDREEFVHRKVSKMQRIDAGNIPEMLHK